MKPRTSRLLLSLSSLLRLPTRFTAGAVFRREHEKHGVRFQLGSIVYRFEGSHNIEAVTLDNGESIETDMVVVGVGVRPATNFLEGVELDKSGGVVVVRGCARLMVSTRPVTSLTFPICAQANARASSTGTRLCVLIAPALPPDVRRGCAAPWR